MTSADSLRALAQAASDGAEALDQLAQADATISGLETSNASLAGQVEQLQAQVAQLEAQLNNPPAPTPPPQPASRFPGDPGPGKIVVGAIVSGAAGTADAFETTNHCKLGAHRTYFNNGIGDLAGPVLAFVNAEHAAGRIPVASIKPGQWSDVAAGKYDAQFGAFRDAVEALGKPVRLIVNHEPQNDGQPASDFRAAQARIRRVIGTGLRRLSFGGSLMAYGWTSQGTAKFGPADSWFPGPGVWDWCGIDQYAQTSGAPIDDGKFEAATASMHAWGVAPAITELGIRASDPDGAAKLAALVDKAVGYGYALIDYYDSDNNSTQNGWVLSGALLAAFVKLLDDPRTVRPAA